MRHNRHKALRRIQHFIILALARMMVFDPDEHGSSIVQESKNQVGS
jgi:hypothetical protein